jgi:hypothetical protein
MTMLVIMAQCGGEGKWVTRKVVPAAVMSPDLRGPGDILFYWIRFS